MTLGATYCEAQPHRAHSGSPVDQVFEPELCVINTALAIRQSIAVKSSGNFLFGSSVGKLVAGDLLDGEAVKGHVAVEGFDHPLAITPGVRARPVFLVPVGIGVACFIYPLPRPLFSV